MRYPELRIGEEYILDRPRQGRIAIYEGKHEGKLDLADGSSFFGGGNFLRFRIREAGQQEIVLLENAGGVQESVKTKAAREAEQAKKQERTDAALKEVQTYLGGLGFEVRTGNPSWGREEESNVLYIRSHEESADKIRFDYVSFAKLKQLIKQPVTK